MVKRSSMPASPLDDLPDDLLAQAWAQLGVYECTRLSGLSRRVRRCWLHALGIALELSPEQTRCFLDAMRGKNVFITGGAGAPARVGSGWDPVPPLTALPSLFTGVGKSHTVGAIVDHLRPNTFAVTASTGCAAAIIGASTLHSLLGLGIGNDTAAECNAKLRRHKDRYARLKELRCIIIDEVSLLDGATYQRASEVMAIVRQTLIPMVAWGGLQVIAVGDFCQLAPVQLNNGWAFGCQAWQAVNPTVHHLKQVHRHAGDPTFAEVLGRVRVGEAKAEDLAYLRTNSAQREPPDALQLFAKNDDADALNVRRFSVLLRRGERAHRFCAVDSGTKQWLLKNCPAPKELLLACGARVMCLRNIESGLLVNGSTGTVKEITPTLDANQAVTGASITVLFDGLMGSKPFTYVFRTYTSGMCEAMHYEFTTLEGKQTVACRAQIPLRLAWAVSIHKSQGMSLDRVCIDCEGVFAAGQAYVALSRCRSLAGIHLSGLRLYHLRMTSAEALEWYAAQAGEA